MHAFFINLANRQTDKRTRAKTFTSYFVGGNNITVNTTSRDLELVDRHWKLIHEKWPGLLAESYPTADRSRTIMAQKRGPLSCWTRSMFVVIGCTCRPTRKPCRVVNLVWHVMPAMSWRSLVAAGQTFSWVSEVDESATTRTCFNFERSVLLVYIVLYCSLAVWVVIDCAILGGRRI